MKAGRRPRSIESKGDAPLPTLAITRHKSSREAILTPLQNVPLQRALKGVLPTSDPTFPAHLATPRPAARATQQPLVSHPRHPWTFEVVHVQRRRTPAKR